MITNDKPRFEKHMYIFALMPFYSKIRIELTRYMISWSVVIVRYHVLLLAYLGSRVPHSLVDGVAISGQVRIVHIYNSEIKLCLNYRQCLDSILYLYMPSNLILSVQSRVRHLKIMDRHNTR